MKAYPYLNQLTNELVLYVKAEWPNTLALFLADGDTLLDYPSGRVDELFCNRGMIAAIRRQAEIIDAEALRLAEDE